jgi:hypothetical protein
MIAGSSSPAAPTATNLATLHADDLPPLRAPLRFFLTAPLFLALAGGVWCWIGEPAFTSRFATSMLAATHLLTLGFFTMVMCGALLQVVPVLGGRPVPLARAVARIVHAALSLGALALANGLMHMSRLSLQLALALLGVAFAVFVAAVAMAVLGSRTSALRPVRFAGLAFVATITLGALLTIALISPRLGFEYRTWTDVHATWGGLGWGMLLVIAVGYQVVPMFHVTPAFPDPSVRWTVPIMTCGLAALALPAPAPAVGTLLVALAGLAHVLVALRLLRQRRRRRPDATVLAWQTGLVCIGVALALALIDVAAPRAMRPSASIRSFDLLLAMLFGFAGLGSIVIGMLTKIVPFLGFLHLQRRALSSPAASRLLPTMTDFLGQRPALTQIGLHLIAAAAVAAAVLAPSLARLCGALVVADGVLLFAILVRAAVRYSRAGLAIDRAVAATGAVSAGSAAGGGPP